MVKLIDVYPDNFPRLPAEEQYLQTPMSGYQMLVRGEVMRAKFRNGYSAPEPLIPGRVSRVQFDLPDVAHTFKRGHRIMVQVQSSWFPLLDRNPQKFLNIYRAAASDYQKATHRVYLAGDKASRLKVNVLKKRQEAARAILGSMICKALGRLFLVWLVAAGTVLGQADLPRAFVDGNGPGWRALGEDDFVNVNCADDTWSWKDGMPHATGTPTCVLCTPREYTNFELVVQWQHLRSGGNSGVFVWSTPESHVGLQPGRLPSGVEVQILDPGFTEQWIKSGKKADFFTAHGDVFAVGASKMTPFPPLSPNGTRSFPTKDLVRSTGHWNHYYVRAINGEIRLWVNGEEVSGGTGADPASGYLCLESEGSPVQFKSLRVRELP